MPFDKDQENDEQETQVADFDIEAASAEISSELFGQGSEEDKDKLPEGEKKEVSGTEADAPTSSPQQEKKPNAEMEAEEKPADEENSAEVQAVGAPKTWNKEELAKWATLPKETQEVLAPILARREEDFLKGITQYKDAADLGVRYSKVVEPYSAMLAAEQVDPVGLFQSFAANHYKLSRGTVEEKVQIAADLMQGYGIPLADLLNHIADTGADEPVDPRYASLEQRLNDVTTQLKTRESAEQTAISNRIAKEIEDFAADPAHPHFNEVAADIQRLFAAGAANTLQEAYDKAIWANPTTREKEIARLETEKDAARKAEEERLKEKQRKSQADHVEVLGKPRDGTVAKGTMDDTLQETLASIQGRA